MIGGLIGLYDTNQLRVNNGNIMIGVIAVDSSFAG
jgi:hypothetical protein